MNPARAHRFLAFPFAATALVLIGIWIYEVGWELRRRSRSAVILDAVVAADPEAVDPAHEGRLVLVHGRLSATQSLGDPTLNVTYDAIAVRRCVATWAWTESRTSHWDSNPNVNLRRLVSVPTYKREWTEAFRASSAFMEPRGHENPADLALSSEVFVAAGARLGGRNVPRMPDHYGNTWQDMPAPPGLLERLPARLAGRARVAEGKLWLSADPARPELGDQRVRWEVVSPQPVTLLMAQRGRDLVPWTTPWGHTLAGIEAGEIDLAELKARGHFGIVYLDARPIFRAANPGLLVIAFLLVCPGILLLRRARRLQSGFAAAAAAA